MAPEARFCYTINANHGGLASYPELLDNSLESLLRFADPGDVAVHYTPPLDYSHVSRLTDRGLTVILHQDTYVDSGQAMKLYMADVDCERLVFLDADTVVYRDPRPLFDGSWDVAARPPPANDSLDWDLYWELCDEHGVEPIPYLSTGFVMFDGGIHRRIRSDWERIWNWFKDEGAANPIGSERYDEMFAFALAVSANAEKVHHLTPDQHAFEWRGEATDECYVHEVERLGGRSWDEVRSEVKNL